MLSDLCPRIVHGDSADALGCLHLQLIQTQPIWSWTIAFYPLSLPSFLMPDTAGFRITQGSIQPFSPEQWPCPRCCF